MCRAGLRCALGGYGLIRALLNVSSRMWPFRYVLSGTSMRVPGVPKMCFRGMGTLARPAARLMVECSLRVSEDEIDVAYPDNQQHGWKGVLAVSSPADSVTFLLGNGRADDIG